MRKGNIIRFHINRPQYHLKPSKSNYANILCGTVIKWHKDKVSVRAMDIFGDKQVKYLTIKKDDIIKIL